MCTLWNTECALRYQCLRPRNTLPLATRGRQTSQKTFVTPLPMLVRCARRRFLVGLDQPKVIIAHQIHEHIVDICADRAMRTHFGAVCHPVKQPVHALLVCSCTHTSAVPDFVCFQVMNVYSPWLIRESCRLQACQRNYKQQPQRSTLVPQSGP
jgi:hypothetical protein